VSTIPPGWYKDPADPATQRWWDGEGWLGDPIPADATPPDGPPPVAAAAATAPGGLSAEPAATPNTPAGAWAGGQAGSGHPTVLPPAGAGTGPIEPTMPWPMSHRYPIAAPRPHGFMIAGSGARFMARLVDILAVLLLAGLANVWFAIEFWRNFEPVVRWVMSRPVSVETVPGTVNRAFELMILMGVVLTAVWFAYEVPASANSGQTLGKRLLGIKVVRVEADERLGFGRSFRRWFRLAWPTPFWVACYGLPILLQVIDCLFVATDRRLHQALHDRITHTVVVQLPRAGRPETARTPVDTAG
jgi:uncharacterized RDD family membrane protein YckC